MSWIPDFCKPWSLGELIAQAVGGVAKTPRGRARPETGKSKSQAGWRSVWPILDLDFRPGSGREGSRKSRLLKSEQRGRGDGGESEVGWQVVKRVVVSG